MCLVKETVFSFLFFYIFNTVWFVNVGVYSVVILVQASEGVLMFDVCSQSHGC